MKNPRWWRLKATSRMGSWGTDPWSETRLKCVRHHICHLVDKCNWPDLCVSVFFREERPDPNEQHCEWIGRRQKLQFDRTCLGHSGPPDRIALAHYRQTLSSNSKIPRDWNTWKGIIRKLDESQPIGLVQFIHAVVHVICPVERTPSRTIVCCG